LIEHTDPQDWFEDNSFELDHKDGLNQRIEHSNADTRRNQVFAYMSEER